MINNREIGVFGYEQVPKYIIEETSSNAERYLSKEVITSLREYCKTHQLSDEQYTEMCISNTLIQYFLGDYIPKAPELLVVENMAIIQTPEKEVVYILPTEDCKLCYRVGGPKGEAITAEEIGLPSHVPDVLVDALIKNPTVSSSKLSQYILNVATE